jgi:hypothetical protein
VVGNLYIFPPFLPRHGQGQATQLPDQVADAMWLVDLEHGDGSINLHNTNNPIWAHFGVQVTSTRKRAVPDLQALARAPSGMNMGRARLQLC